MRAHANYGENMPLVLILIGLIELAGGDARILWAAGILFILSRILHAFGMDRGSPSRLRAIGMIGNTIVLLGLAGWALSFAYLQPPRAEHETMIGPGRVAAAHEDADNLNSRPSLRARKGAAIQTTSAHLDLASLRSQ